MTKKYSGVYTPLVERLLAEERQKGSDKVKAVKTKLHQIYGAYAQDNAYKKAAKLLDVLEQSVGDTQSPALQEGSIEAQTPSFMDAAKKLLSLHASTKERLPYYPDFYDFIKEYTGPIESILDIGCGYNPFSAPLIPKTGLKYYYAYDIDIKAAELINRFFAILGLPPLAKCMDLAVHIPEDTADIAFICKLLPVLEAQSPGSGFRLVRGLNVRHLLITYPLKSLGGREKGMCKHYGAAFENALAKGELGRFTLVGQKQVGWEMLYLLT